MHQMATFIVILYIIPCYLNRLIILFLNSNLPEPHLNFVFVFQHTSSSMTRNERKTSLIEKPFVATDSLATIDRPV